MFRKKTNLKNFTLATSMALALTAGLFTAEPASAVPITGAYVDDIRADVVPNQAVTHELGDIVIFPLNEAIQYGVTATTTYVAVPDDLNLNDWKVTMINNSGVAWQDLFFVVDVGGVVGNADGTLEDSVGASGVFTDAFRIDSTVTGGANNPNLVFESGIADDIFSPGEQWEFIVTNFTAGAGFVPPNFISPGQFAGSSPYSVGVVGNASIVANQVPEPSSLALAGLGMAALLRRRQRRVQ